jgi:cytochrome c553
MKTMLLMTILLTGMVSSSCSPVTFPSEESKTFEGNVVYNEVSWSSDNGQDTWIMKQSLHGQHFPKKDWDEIRITVKNKEATFSQWKDGHEIPLKASCFRCHSNGPRAIRPMPGLSLWETAQIQLMNLRIKSYGPLKAMNTGNNFRQAGKNENEVLTLSACMKCHNEKDMFGRGHLTKQNAGSIEFMITNEHMPPLGSLSDEEKEYLWDFVHST